MDNGNGSNSLLFSFTSIIFSVGFSKVGGSGHAFSVCLDLVYQYNIKFFNFLSLLRSSLLALRHLDAQFSNFIKDEAYPF